MPPMTARQSRYVESICRSAGVPFDHNMSQAAAQTIINEQSQGWMTREDVRQVACPKCGAPAESRCYGVRKPWRESNHMERVKSAQGRAIRGGFNPAHGS